MTLRAHKLSISRLLLRIAVIAIFGMGFRAQAQDAANFDQQLATAKQSELEGRVQESFEALARLILSIDPGKQPELYWRASTQLIEALTWNGDHTRASQMLLRLDETKIPERQSAYFPWMQFYVGRTLAWTGKADEGEKVLRALTQGDLRLVLTPAQRAAALMLSKINLDRRDISQSMIWMRRAVIGTLTDEGSGSEEIIDALTQYAVTLTAIRKWPEDNALFRKLVPIYDKYFSHHSPKYLLFASQYLSNLTAAGLFERSDAVLKVLSDSTAGVDRPPEPARAELFFQNLYKAARHPPNEGQPSTRDQLSKIIADFPDFSKRPQTQIRFSYYALLSLDLELAEKLNSDATEAAASDIQYAAYNTLLRSFFAARRERFDESIKLATEGLEKIRQFMRLAENESSSRLPELAIEERLVLSLIATNNGAHIKTFDQASSLFQLQQYVNRDKGKLGLNASANRRGIKSALRQEDVRSRDRLLEIRDKIMQSATDALMDRILPVRGYSPGKKNDFGSLLKLEEVENKIAVANEQLDKFVPNYASDAEDRPIDLGTIQHLLRSNEAVVVHSTTTGGMLTTCIRRDSWTFNVKPVDPSAFHQFEEDQRTLFAAVDSTQPPSASVYSDFAPGESSHRLYQFFFGQISNCLNDTTHILLATDPDFFSTPWNALLTEAPLAGQKFVYREAAWLPKKYSLSLLPSVRSLFQLRQNLSASRANEKFLGVGDPELKGAPDRKTEIALAPLFVSRGVANLAAISELEALPETADELRTIADALGREKTRILLGKNATERELRKQPLNDFRVVSFATHAVVAGGVDGLTEPALVLTPGDNERNGKNDGLLTASEIGDLVLDANLVILSACNTAASDGQASGRGLSGLADAFFFAGARSVAVTQWRVDSETATQIGSGLISRTVGYFGVGVAEGLRQTMLKYIATVNEDYLAHPRFWAAFIIAGDGAVRPLSQAPGDKELNQIKVRRDALSPAGEELEYLGLAGDGNTSFAVGMLKPLPHGEKQYGSYLSRIERDGTASTVLHDPEMAAAGVVRFGQGIGLLGYYPNDTSVSAVFRLLDNNGREQWRYLERSDLSAFPASMVKTSGGYVLVSMERDFGNAGSLSTLVMTAVSESGKVTLQRRIPTKLHSGSASSKAVVLNASGDFLIAIVDEYGSNGTTTRWTNPRTGSTKFCTSTIKTALLEISGNSLELKSQRLLEGDGIVSLRQSEGRTFAAMRFSANCDLERRLKLSEIGPNLEPKTIFETTNVNSISVTDLIVTPEYFVLAGGVRTLLPTSLTTKIKSSEELLASTLAAQNLSNEAYWESHEEVGNGFVIVLRKDGSILADSVFADQLNRTISAMELTGNNSIVAVGSAYGNRGWVLSFDLSETNVLKDRFLSWLGWLRTSTGRLLWQ